MFLSVSVWNVVSPSWKAERNTICAIPEALGVMCMSFCITVAAFQTVLDVI